MGERIQVKNTARVVRTPSHLKPVQILVCIVLPNRPDHRDPKGGEIVLDGTGLTYCTLQAIYEYMICLKIKELKRREKGLPV